MSQLTMGLHRPETNRATSRRLAGIASVLVVTAVFWAAVWALEDELVIFSVFVAASVASVLSIGCAGWVAGGIRSISTVRRIALGCLGPVVLGVVVLLWSFKSVETDFPYPDAVGNVATLMVTLATGVMYYSPYWIGFAAALVATERRAKNRPL